MRSIRSESRSLVGGSAASCDDADLMAGHGQGKFAERHGEVVRRESAEVMDRTEPGAAADGGRHPGASEFVSPQRGRRC